MNPGRFYNRPVADWARQNIRGHVKVRPFFSSRAGMIFAYSLLFCAPAAFFALGIIAFLLGARDRASVVSPFIFGFLLLIPCGVMALVAAYVRRGFVKSLDAEGVSGSFGQRFLWEKLYYVDHVSKYYVSNGVRRRIKDNQIELVFAGGKVIIPPLIHDRGRIWALVNSMPAQVRDDGVPRAGHVPGAG